jgi:hypothetical protein
MIETPAKTTVDLAVEAAELLFRSETPSSVAIREPRGREEVRAAVNRFGQLFQGLPGSVVVALEAARDSADLLSSDRLQGLAEIIQNADDVEAREVRITLTGGSLLVGHNGQPLRLANVLALAMPWLTTMGGESGSLGRFGIGLMTLRALSSILDVHCEEYHVRIGSPTLSFIEDEAVPHDFYGSGWTVFRVPVAAKNIGLSDIEAWLDAWDDSALLFLGSVSRISLFTEDGRIQRTLSLEWSKRLRNATWSTRARRASARIARSEDGRSWIVYSETRTPPKGLSRARKRVGATTPVSVALAVHEEDAGLLYAGLPLSKLSVPVRVNAQFDPLASRQGMASNDWNSALFDLVADLWVRSLLRSFATEPARAWRLVPTFVASDLDRSSEPIRELQTLLLQRARERLATEIEFEVPPFGKLPLSHLAVEEPRLEAVLTGDEVAALAGLPAAIPASVRDGAGDWRNVLNDWRAAGAALPPEVNIKLALRLLGQPDTSPEKILALAAAGIQNHLAEELRVLPWIVLHDGSRLAPPPRNASEPLLLGPIPLTEELGVGQRLHHSFFVSSPDTDVVLEWLRAQSSLLAAVDSKSVLQHLAMAGNSGRTLTKPLSDQQLNALRDACESLSPLERSSLGPGIGRLILLDGFTWTPAGERNALAIRPADAYLPRSIDREEEAFSFASASAPGIPWLHSRYADVLRSASGRSGLGAQRFLHLLGAEAAPRVRPQSALYKRYADSRVGLARDASGSPPERRQALSDLDATFTLDDYECSDLQKAVLDISRESDPVRRRRRAYAMLGVLSRSWERLADYREVPAAYDYMAWQLKGDIPAFWLWSAGSVAWLDDAAGTPRRPLELRLHTPGTLAMYGKESSNFLHPIFSGIRPEVLEALGVQGEPTTAELLDKLVGIRDNPDSAGPEVSADTAIIYQAIAERLTKPGAQDVSLGRLRQRFSQGRGLVSTSSGWRRPDAVMMGPPVFGYLRAFVPQVPGAEPLWRTLRVQSPTQTDCVDVVRTLARESQPSQSQLTVVLETLRLLAALVGQAKPSPSFARVLSSLPLWTSLGWKRTRPVYAIDDPVLADRLGSTLPMWQPGGELDQFRPLVQMLRITRLSAANAEIVVKQTQNDDEDLTETFRATVALLREDLSRNDAHAASALRIPWDELLSFKVQVHTDLQVRIAVPESGDHTIRVIAKAQLATATLYVDHPNSAAKSDGGGRAVASLFDANHRPIALAWRAAWEKAEDGIVARQVLLAEQRAKLEQEEARKAIAQRLQEFQATAAAAQQAKGRSTATKTVATNQKDTNTTDNPAGHHRTLVDPDALNPTDKSGVILNGSSGSNGKTSGETTKERKLAPPNRDGGSPRSRTAPPVYTQITKESVGLELLRRVLGSDAQGVSDLRVQHGVGADAMDALDRFYELKVYSGAEPNRITLTESEIQRALESPDFFLVVVSHVEKSSAKPSVRIIPDPLRQLRIEGGSLSFVGIQDSQSLVYEFAEASGTSGTSG